MTEVRPAARPRIGLLILMLVLLGEVLALSLLADGQALSGHSSGLLRLVAHAGLGLRLAVVAGVAVAMVGGSGRILAVVQGPAARGQRVAFLAAHLAAYVAFAVLTVRLFQDRLPSFWAIAWLVLGALVLAFWAAALVPPRDWHAVARAAIRPVTLGAAVAIPAAALAGSTVSLWTRFHHATFRLTAATLGVLFPAVIVDASRFVVGTHRFSVEIAPSCSGYEGIGLISAFLGAYLVLDRRHLRFPAALLLLPLGIAIIWTANIVRIVALVTLGSLGFERVAAGGFHSQAGWLAFNAVALGLVVASRRLGLFRRGDDDVVTAAATGRGTNPTAEYLGPWLAILATTMLTGAFTPGGSFDALYPLRVLAALAALAGSRRVVAAVAVRWSWPAVAAGVGVFALWRALERPDPVASAALRGAVWGLPAWAAALWILARVVGSVVTVPLAEELAFRGYLTRRWLGADFESVAPTRLTALALLGSSLLFGVLHGRWLAGTLAGLVYAGCYRRRGDLGEAILAHAVTNGLIAGAVLFNGSWSLWT